MAVIFLSGDARVLKDEYVEALCRKKMLKKIKISLEESKRIPELVSQMGLFSKDFLIDVVDFDEWKKVDQKELLQQLSSSNFLAVLRTFSTSRKTDAIDFSLPKPWEKEKWIEYISKRFEKSSLEYNYEGVEKFFDFVGADDLLIERETEKLACIGEKVTPDIVSLAVCNYSKIQMEEFCFAVSTLNRHAHYLLHDMSFYTEIVALVNVLSKHFVDLYRILSAVERRDSYSWMYIKNISQKLNMPVVKSAKFLGFSFKNQPSSINHVKIYSFEKLRIILRQLQYLDREVKSSEYRLIAIHVFIDFVFRLMEGET